MLKIKKTALYCFILAQPSFFFSNFSFAEDDFKMKAEGYQEQVAESKMENLSPYQPDPIAKIPPPGKFPRQLTQLGDGSFFSKIAFVADKSTRTLSIWRNNKNTPELINAYPMDMGRKPGNKTVLGDLKTPEGIYFFQQTYEKKHLDNNEYGERAFTMDYPNYFDKMEHKTGSGIWLHAIPETKTLKRGSRGCLVVRNNVINKLADYITLKQTPIIVQEKVEYVTSNELTQQRNKLIQWLKFWKKSWEEKNIDAYISLYHDEFKSMKMNKKQWRIYKDGLNKKYDYINVKVVNPVIYQNNQQVTIRFLQEYNSNLTTDYGEKILYIKKSDKGLQIVGESWEPITADLVALLKNTPETKSL